MSIEDQRAKIRQVRYNGAAVIAAAGPALAAALLYGGVDKWVAFLVAAATSLAGAAGSRVAGRKTGEQRTDGMFDQDPSVPVAQQAINAITTVVQDAAAKTADLNAVASAAAEQLGIPAVAKSIAEKVDDAIQHAAHR